MFSSKKNNTAITVPEDTSSLKSLLKYALPYAIGYHFLPIFLSKLGLYLDWILMTIFVILVLNTLIITLFIKTQQRVLNKKECSYIGMITAFIEVVLSDILLIFILKNSLPDSFGIENFFTKTDVLYYRSIQAVAMLFIHYIAVRYSLGFMQKKLSLMYNT